MSPPEPTPSHRLQTINDLLLFRLSRLSAQAGTMVIRLCEGGQGISRKEWGVIGLLQEDGPLAPSALAERIRMDRARTSRLVTSLVGKGLVQREVQAANRRQALLRLSPAGQALYEDLMPRIQSINRQILSALSVEEMAQLDNFIVRLQQATDGLRDQMDHQLPKTQRRLGRRRTQGTPPGTP